jgi:eukaryotic-like serine/threonine-protein kinase
VTEAFPSIAAHYRIVSLIGAGGMGEVYLADDIRLGRRVAIKILPESIGRDADAKRRMLREARAVAALDHPNVCTIYEVGDLDARPYIVMQYIEGETLFDRLRDSRLTLTECLEIGTGIAAALDEAHSHGVIHRDIKPMNIMLTPRGQVKVLDFGLAKFSDATEGPTEILKSHTGIVTGTAPYMSPEQLRAAPLDARSDIFSLGVVLYEMATGRRPFDRESTVATITAILFEEPEPITDDGFAPLAPIVRQAIAKEPARRFATSRLLLEALETVRARTRRPVKRQRTAEVERTESMNTAVVAPAKARFESLSVLPFVTGTLDPALEYLVYGLSEGIANALSHVRKLRVVAAGSAAERYAANEIDAQQAGRDLNVGAVVGVKATIEGDMLHADVTLIASADGSQLWSASYARPIREIAALSEGIADDVIEHIRVRGGSGTRRAVKKKRAVDPEAQQLFLKGRFQWIKRHPEALKQAIAYFQNAVELDPQFAMPYVGLADSFVMLGFAQALPPRDILPKVKAAARRAVELDPTLADPHATLGYAAGLFEWDWDTAQRELEEAMHLNPNYPWAPHWLGVLMCGRGMTRRGLELIDLSKTLDPLSPIISIGEGIPLHVAGKYDQAIATYRAVLETNPTLAPGHYYLGMTLEARGDYDEAAEQIQRAIEIAGPTGLFLGGLAHVFSTAGRHDEAERIVEQMRGLARQRYLSPYCFALAYAGMRRLDEAFTSLSEALAEHNAWMWFVPIDIRFDPMREDERFEPLMKSHGLPARLDSDG